MSDILGFAVLSGPLWLIVLWLPVSTLVAVKLSKRFKPTATRIAAGVGIFLLAYFLPFADEIIGRMYFNYLCTHEAGVKVYQVVELPAEYWDEQGRAKFYEKNGNFTLDGYRIRYDTGVYHSLLHVDNAGYKWMEKLSGRVLGQVTDFRYWGGWMRRNLSPHNSADACKNRRMHADTLVEQIFRRENH